MSVNLSIRWISQFVIFSYNILQECVEYTAKMIGILYKNILLDELLIISNSFPLTLCLPHF